ncbi:MAG TPA: hypothetical protein VM100_07595 [Longimicrobiales bacterium]|nr:hypothetical protein [Longimicrobiales bacterium]
MPIPPFNGQGLLPAEIHDATLDEIRERFGRFQESDRRMKLFARLSDFIQAARTSGLFEELLIDGSFVTVAPTPNDIDIIAVLKPGHDFERDLPMSEYSLVSRSLLARRFGFDVIVAEQASDVYKSAVEFFSRVRSAPEMKKGLLRLKP